MSVWVWFMAASAAISVFWLLMVRRNLGRYLAPPQPDPDAAELVSICVPARNEEANIGACVESLLASEHTNVEVLVYNDGSTDRTGEIVAELAARDPRVKLVETRPLPSDWSGKQHACDRMGRAATGDWLLFTDADVRFARGCVGRTLAQAKVSGVALVSTFPRQVVKTAGEALQVPMMFVLLMGYLPMAMMRAKKGPGPSAGCGQFLFVRRDTYLESGGHETFKSSFHDGIRLPKAVRATGEGSDLFDGSNLCGVRMYRGFGDAWQGFAKNAYEGLGSPVLLVFLSVMHLGGHVLPWAMLPWLVMSGDLIASGLAVLAILAQMGGRLMLGSRFAHPAWLAIAHPVSMLLMTLVQWHSFWLQLTGSRSWRGRRPGSAEPVSA